MTDEETLEQVKILPGMSFFDSITKGKWDPCRWQLVAPAVRYALKGLATAKGRDYAPLRDMAVDCYLWAQHEPGVDIKSEWFNICEQDTLDLEG